MMKRRDRIGRAGERNGLQGWRGRRLLRGFSRHHGGAASVEFAILALPFLLFVFAIIESCISFAAQQMLANATDDMARQFRTGQYRMGDVVQDPMLVEKFICNRIRIVVANDCPGLVVDLKSYDNFAQAAASQITATSNGDIDDSKFDIELGPSGSKNQLRVYYRWPVMTDFMRKSMSDLPDGKVLLHAMVTWQNEPFDD